MGLEEIIKDIDTDTKSRAKQVLDQAHAEAKMTLESSEAEEKAIHHAAESKAASDSRQELVREASRANVEAKGIYQQAVSEYINSATDTLAKSLQAYTKSAQYKKLMPKLAKSASNQLGSGCTITVQALDLKLLSGASVGDANIAKSKEQFAGGLKAVSQDGKRYIDYSLESIAESLSDSITVKLLGHIR